MKFQTLFAAALGPLTAIFATATARDIKNGTVISTNNGTSTLYNKGMSTLSKNSTSTLYNNVTSTSTNNGTSTSLNNGTAISTNNGTAISTDIGTANLHCDANCAHRLIFLSGYNAARDGYRMVLDAYDGYDWCFSDAKEWCPDVINSTTTRIASQIKTDVAAGFDYNNIHNLTLLSTVLTVNARSRRTGISMAQSVMEASPLTCSEDRVTDLEKMRWLMAQQEGPIDYDANKFDEYIADQNGEILEKRSENACKVNPVMCSNMPWLRRLLEGARKLLSKLKSKLLRSAIEKPTPLSPLEEIIKYWELRYWWEDSGPKATENWIDDVADPFEPVPKDVLQQPGSAEPIEPPEFPLDFGKGVPKEDIPFGAEPHTLHRPSVRPVEAKQLFRAEIFDQYAGRVKEFTVTPSTATRMLPHIKDAAVDLGLEAFDVLDSVGNRVSTKYLDPSTLISTPGEWFSLGTARSEQFVRQQFNQFKDRYELVLNSLGEPLVASAAGTFMNLAPVGEAGAGAFVGGAVDGAASAIGSIFDIFRPEGGQPSESRLTFDPVSGSVDIHDPSAPPGGFSENIGDQQNNDDEKPENESDHSKTNESKEHEATDNDDHKDSEDNENNPDEIEATQTAETTASKTTAPETTAPEATAPEATVTELTAGEPTTATATPNTDTLDFATPNSYLPTNAPPTPDAEHTQTTGAPKQTSIPHRIQQGKPGDGPTTSLPTVVESPIPSTKSTTSKTKSEKSVSSTKSVTSVPSTTSSLNLKSDYLVPHTTLPVPTIVHKTTQEPETQHHATSNPYPYPNSHLHMTFPAPTKTHDATEAIKTHSSNVYPYPDDHPLPTSKKEIDDEATSNVVPFPNSHIPKTFPASTKAHDATEAMRTHTNNIYPYPHNYHHTPAPEKTCTHDGIYPYPDNYCPHTAKKETHTQATSNLYPYPNNHASPTPTTFATVTKSHESKTSTSTSAMPAVTTLTGCQSNSDCPVCSFDTSCQIGDLPPECVRNAINIDNVAISGNYTWDDCVAEIWKLDRAEAKAWAVAITSPVCLTGSEWEPKYMDRGHVSECWLDVRGDKFAKVRDIWITGLLPLKCPSDRDIKDGGWHGYGEDLKDDCKKVADVLCRPFNDD